MQRLLFLCIAFCAIAAQAATGITSERMIATPATAAPLTVFSTAAVVSDGDDYLAVWSELGSGNVQAAIVTRGGEVRRPRTIYTGSDIGLASACWTGSMYLIAWYAGNPEAGAYAATLGRDGSLLSGPSLIMRGVYPFSVASNGRRALMAYTRPVIAGPMKAALFDASGNILATELPLGSESGAPHVASDGNEFGLMWDISEPPYDHNRTVRFLRLSDAGEPIGAPLTVGRLGGTGNWGITAGGGVYAIAGIDESAQPRLARFVVDARSGTVTAQPPIDTVTSYHANVVWNGNRFVAYWMSDNTSPSQLFTLPFDAAPESVAPRPTLSEQTLARDWPALGSNGTSILACWSEHLHDPAPEMPIRGAFFDAGGAIASAPFLVSLGWSRQFAPAIATSGAESLVVWVDSDVSNHARIVGRRVAADGTPIDAEPFTIGDDTSPYDTPAAVFTGAAYLVVFQHLALNQTAQTLAARVGRDGSVGNPTILAGGSAPAAASNGTTTLVVLQSTGITGYRFDRNAMPIDAAPLQIGSAGGLLPKVATNGTDFFVAWSTGYDAGNANFPNPPDLLDVYGVRVTAAGAVDAQPLPIAIGPSDQFLEAIASDGRDYTVFYGLFDASHPAPLLAAKRVLREGQLDGTTAQDAGTIVGPGFWGMSIVRNASGFRLAGNTLHDGSVAIVRTDFAGNSRGSMTLTEPHPFIDPSRPFRSFVGYNPDLSLAAAGDGSFQLAYARRITAGDYAGTSLVFVRTGDDDADRARAVRH